MPGDIGIERLGPERLDRLALGQGRHGELVDASGLQRLLHLGVGAEGSRPLLEDEVRAHVGGCGDPDVVADLGAQRLVVEVARAVVAVVLQQVDQVERALQVAVAEDEVLVVLDAVLAVEIDVEELALPERLGHAVDEVEARPSARGRPPG